MIQKHGKFLRNIFMQREIELLKQYGGRLPTCDLRYTPCTIVCDTLLKFLFAISSIIIKINQQCYIFRIKHSRKKLQIMILSIHFFLM